MFSGLGFGYENLRLISSLINLVERQVGNHLEGVPFYGTRGDVSGPEISNRLAGSKRSNSESGFMGHDYPENLHLMKVCISIISHFSSSTVMLVKKHHICH